MQTDTLFYRLFQNFPQQAFTLLDLPLDPNQYQFLSQEIKQPSFRIDGIFKPNSDAPEQPIIFTEVQFQPDPKFYDRFFTEILLYHSRQTISSRWLAFVIYPDRKTEKPARTAFKSLMHLPEMKRIYLEDFKHRSESCLELVQLVASTPDETVDLVQTLVEKNAKIDAETIEFIETVLVYKLPKLSREEIKIMLGLDVQLKQTRFYQEIAEEERREGKIEGERLFLSKQIAKRFGPLSAGIAAKLEQAGNEELELWGERILEAQTLSQLFD